MPNRSHIVDRDRGYRALVKRVGAAARGRAVTVGVHSGEGGAPSSTGGGTVADIASIHEFGLGVPERSFVRGWVDSNEDTANRLLREVGEAIVRGRYNVDTGLDRAGLVMAASMQQRIRGHIPPELSPATIARKGSSTPLIDTGQLVASITHKVE